MKISWDNPGSRLFETGVDRGVFFPNTGDGVPWNGLTSIKETSENSDSIVIYIDGQKTPYQLELGIFAADISAITYPDEMYPYDGYKTPFYTGQPRPFFNLSYRSLIGNDVEGVSYGYRLHLIFNCLLTPTNRAYASLNAESDILEFEWKLSTTPVSVLYNRQTSHFIIDSTQVASGALEAIENLLYGVTAGNNPTFPTVQQILNIFENNSVFIVVDNLDGTATITAPDDWVYPVATNQYYISSPSVTIIDATRILAKSY